MRRPPTFPHYVHTMNKSIIVACLAGSLTAACYGEDVCVRHDDGTLGSACETEPAPRNHSLPGLYSILWTCTGGTCGANPLPATEAAIDVTSGVVTIDWVENAAVIAVHSGTLAVDGCADIPQAPGRSSYRLCPVHYVLGDRTIDAIGSIVWKSSTWRAEMEEI